MFKLLKERLKAIGWISALNAANKARSLRKEYASTVAYYADCPEWAFDSLLVTRLGNRRKKLDPSRTLRLFFLGTMNCRIETVFCRPWADSTNSDGTRAE